MRWPVIGLRFFPWNSHKELAADIDSLLQCPLSPQLQALNLSQSVCQPSIAPRPTKRKFHLDSHRRNLGVAKTSAAGCWTTLAICILLQGPSSCIPPKIPNFSRAPPLLYFRLIPPPHFGSISALCVFIILSMYIE